MELKTAVGRIANCEYVTDLEALQLLNVAFEPRQKLWMLLWCRNLSSPTFQDIARVHVLSDVSQHPVFDQPVARHAEKAIRVREDQLRQEVTCPDTPLWPGDGNWEFACSQHCMSAAA